MAEDLKFARALVAVVRPTAQRGIRVSRMAEDLVRPRREIVQNAQPVVEIRLVSGTPVTNGYQIIRQAHPPRPGSSHLISPVAVRQPDIGSAEIDLAARISGKRRFQTNERS